VKAADLWQIVWVAGSYALAVGAVGLALAWLTRRWTIRWHLLLVSVIAAAGTYMGAMAIAHQMFLSEHDLRVTTVVSSVSAVVAVVVALVVGHAVTRWSTQLRKEVLAITPGSAPVTPSSGPQELRALSTALADAQTRLAEARQREQLLEGSRRELISWVSHDLRTPLAGMRAMAEALEDDLAPDPDRYHRQIREQADKMAAMVDDLFELSRIQAGVLTIAPETFDLGDLISEALATADPVARAHRVHLRGEATDAIEVTADPAGLSRVLSNLLINAIRHTPTEGVVEVAARRTPDSVEFAVTDQCGGLSAETLQRAFDVAWRGESARTPDASGNTLGRGAGLGLAIVRGIVEAHQGTVEVTNLSDQAGCRFSVILPAA
jgi:signal transduction histidine kinase